MDRRQFLKLLGIGMATAAAPKIIFDMGKNSRIYTPQKIMTIDPGFQGDFGIVWEWRSSLNWNLPIAYKNY